MTHAPHFDAVPDTHPRIVAATLGLGAFLTQFDITAVIIAMPAIGRDLGMGVEGLAWIVDAYSLAFTAGLLAAGKLADRFGRRRTLLMGNLAFLLASLACAGAWNAPALWAARAVQGLAAAFVITGAIASIAATFPSPVGRARAFGTVGVLSGIAMALGPTLGAAITAWLGWRWIFLANIPPCILIAVAIPRVIMESQVKSIKPIDWLSVLILTLALGTAIEAFLLARKSWLYCLAGLVIAGVLLFVFAMIQRRRTQPMFDPLVFNSRSMAAIAVLLVAVSVGYWSLLVYLPLFFDAAFGWTDEMAGIGLLAATLPMLLVPSAAARFIARVGWRRLFGVALTTMAIGCAILSGAALTGEPALASTVTVVGMLAIGIGAALAHPQLSGAVVALAPPDTAGMASAITVIARQAGFAIGVAILGTVIAPAHAATDFVPVFILAAIASSFGMSACYFLPGSTASGDR